MKARGGQPAPKSAMRSKGGVSYGSKNPASKRAPMGGPTPKPKQAMRSGAGPKVGPGKMTGPMVTKKGGPGVRKRQRSG